MSYDNTNTNIKNAALMNAAYSGMNMIANGGVDSYSMVNMGGSILSLINPEFFGGCGYGSMNVYGGCGTFGGLTGMNMYGNGYGSYGMGGFGSYSNMGLYGNCGFGGIDMYSGYGYGYGRDATTSELLAEGAMTAINIGFMGLCNAVANKYANVPKQQTQFGY